MVGAMGLRPQKVVLGPMVGAAVGARRRRSAVTGPEGGGGRVLVYRMVSAATFRDAQVSCWRSGAGRGPTLRRPARGSIPLRRHGLRQGLGRGARRHLPRRHGRRRHSRRVDELAGPDFDPGRRRPAGPGVLRAHDGFSLDIVPEWRRWVRPGYLLYRSVLARPLGQASVPMNQREALRGIRSRIDTITLDRDDVVAVRGWIRSFADNDEPIYVGIYTTYRHGGRGYVSVGFPLPQASFTATLEPRPRSGGGPYSPAAATSITRVTT